MRRKKTNNTKLFFKILGYTVLAIIIFSIALTIYSVFGPKEDFTTPIKNNYAIIKESSRSAYIINNSKGADPTKPVVDSIIISYAVSGKYIAAKQTAVPETADIKPDYTKYCYWLINTEDAQVLGPFNTDDEFNSKCLELQLEFKEWIGA